ncbi:MAG: cytochrome c3 family protein [Deltaproteobacteria bacterium]|nr:cytochrome c3 family protein [Deltaproteobacteria bacterium]
MKRSMLVLAVAAMSVVFLFAVVNATQECAETMTMESKLFPTHKKGLVTFTHKKHNVDYKIACADCHHVYTDGKNTWKEGDAVQKCDACHSEAKAATGKDAPKMSKKEKIQKYYYSAIHENCAGCHKALKKEAKPTGPTSCKECHPAK